jgi:2-polyprenyl-3-methyl-5-hydroxy-6-metoxy-1,4-benzoquinol methylase
VSKTRFIEQWKNLLPDIVKRLVTAGLPYRPLRGGQHLLDAEYAVGTWDYLKGVEELSRFSVVAGYCHWWSNGGAILEIGCGEGTLSQRLDRSKYSTYVGVDISSEAIRRSARIQDDKISFVAEDASNYDPKSYFDIVVFNECLYYFPEPLNVLRQYEHSLKPGGAFIVSMYRTRKTRQVWNILEKNYSPKSQTIVSNTAGHTWVIKVF